jgi:hypothetical protein
LFLANTSKDPRKEDIHNLSDIISDSEVGLTEIYGGAPGIFKIGNRVENPPQKIIYIAKCKKGKITVYHEIFWHENKQEKSSWKVSRKKYLNLWEKIENYEVWSMESKDWLEWFEKLKEPSEEDIKKFEKTVSLDYEDLTSEVDTYILSFRIKEKSHTIKVYDPKNLKDKRYLQLVNIMGKFFGWLRELE